jgi:hypothetical protein
MTTILNKNKRRPGRPPKNLVVAKPPVKESVEKKPTEEQLILYLPNFDDEPITNTEKNDFDSMSETQSESYRDSQKNIKTNSKTNSKTESKTESKIKLKHLTDKNDENDENYENDETDKTDESSYDNTNINNLKDSTIEKLIDELHKKDAIIMNLKSKLKDKTLYNENTINITKENKKKLINIGLISINNNKLQVCEKTDLACWWCTYGFDTAPLFLPDHYKNNTYFVFGNFCSFSCMLAYNENLDDYRKSVRTVLIKQLYRDVFQNDNMIIKQSGPRELLKKFGGPLDISQYRDTNNISVKTFKITLPPMIPLIAEMEEINLDK